MSKARIMMMRAEGYAMKFSCQKLTVAFLHLNILNRKFVKNDESLLKNPVLTFIVSVDESSTLHYCL